MNIDKTWTLFLDRDGVINTELRNEYVKNWSEFNFEPGALKALENLSTLFGTIVIVTNQRGVGAGIMTEDDLLRIHDEMLKEINQHGGRIDQIYFATHIDREHESRKPFPAMGHLAKKEFPHIEFSKSVMVGNSLSDMEFGRNLGMVNVYIDEKKKYNGVKTEMMDYIFSDLAEFSNTFKQ
ncbi:D-glycero-alpha-D-manno-heptose-1,7-bisphosphate 7-phosphatase [soil metagenome]